MTDEEYEKFQTMCTDLAKKYGWSILGYLQDQINTIEDNMKSDYPEVEWTPLGIKMLNDEEDL